MTNPFSNESPEDQVKTFNDQIEAKDAGLDWNIVEEMAKILRGTNQDTALVEKIREELNDDERFDNAQVVVQRGLDVGDRLLQVLKDEFATDPYNVRVVIGAVSFLLMVLGRSAKNYASLAFMMQQIPDSLQTAGGQRMIHFMLGLDSKHATPEKGDQH